MADRIKLTAKDIPPMLRNVFPEYHGRKWRANVTTNVQMYDTYWSGGTRNQYRAVNLETGMIGEPGSGAFGNFLDPREPTVELPPGVAIVEHSMFMGKDVGITIHVHPSNVRSMLPARAGGKRRHGGGASATAADVRRLLGK
jgi:hypothetical protein